MTADLTRPEDVPAPLLAMLASAAEGAAPDTVVRLHLVDGARRGHLSVRAGDAQAWLAQQARR